VSAARPPTRPRPARPPAALQTTTDDKRRSETTDTSEQNRRASNKLILFLNRWHLSVTQRYCAKENRRMQLRMLQQHGHWKTGKNFIHWNCKRDLHIALTQWRTAAVLTEVIGVAGFVRSSLSSSASWLYASNFDSWQSFWRNFDVSASFDTTITTTSVPTGVIHMTCDKPRSHLIRYERGFSRFHVGYLHPFVPDQNPRHRIFYGPDS